MARLLKRYCWLLTGSGRLAARPFPSPANGTLDTAWARAVRARSAAENWHGLLRPHLAVHWPASNGLLPPPAGTRLAVWHNHRVFHRRGHRGYSPLHRSGISETPTDWLVAVGHPPDDGSAPAMLRPADSLPLELAA